MQMIKIIRQFMFLQLDVKRILKILNWIKKMNDNKLDVLDDYIIGKNYKK